VKTRLTAIIGASVLLFTAPVMAEDNAPYVTASAKVSGLCKNTDAQSYKPYKWTTFAGCEPFNLGGSRSLFFAQLHLTCTKPPKYVKIRFARLLPDGKRDTTGSTTWVLGKGTPKTWQGSTYWEMKTKHPIVAQFKVGGGKCSSPERQFKYWTP
jgi:hypothetical protein